MQSNLYPDFRYKENLLSNLSHEVRSFCMENQDVQEAFSTLSTKIERFYTSSPRDYSYFNQVVSAQKDLKSKIQQFVNSGLRDTIKATFLRIRQNTFICFLTKQHLKPNKDDLVKFKSLIEKFDPSKPVLGDIYLITLLANSQSPEIRALALECIPKAPLEAKKQALIRAVERGDDTLVTTLIKEGAPPNSIISELLSRKKISNFNCLKPLLPFIDYSSKDKDNQPVLLTLLEFNYELCENCRCFYNDLNSLEELNQQRFLIIENTTNEQIFPLSEDLFDLAIRESDDTTILQLIERGIQPTDRSKIIKFIDGKLNTEIDSISSNNFKTLIKNNLISPNLFQIISRHEDKYNTLKEAWKISSEIEDLFLKLNKLEVDCNFLYTNCYNLELLAKEVSNTFELLKIKMSNDTFCFIESYYSDYIKRLNSIYIERKKSVEKDIDLLPELNRIIKSNEEKIQEYQEVNWDGEKSHRDISASIIRTFNTEKIQNLYNSYKARHVNYLKERSVAHFLLDKAPFMKLKYSGHCLHGSSSETQLFFIIDRLSHTLEVLKNKIDSCHYDIIKNLQRTLVLALVADKGTDAIQPSSFNSELPYVVPTGTKGHAVLFCIEKGSEQGMSRLSLFNTGDGVEKHHRLEKTNKYQTVIAYDNISTNHPLYFLKIQEIQRGFSTISELYHVFGELCKEQKGVIFGEEYYEQIQTIGSCGAQSIMAFMRYYIIKNAPGNPLDKLGFYKFVKAHVLTSVENEQVDTNLQPYVDIKVNQLQDELKIFEVASSMKTTGFPQLEFGNFSHLRSVIKELRLNEAPIPENLLGVEGIIHSRRRVQQENEKLIASSLTNILNQENQHNNGKLLKAEDFKIFKTFRNFFRRDAYHLCAINWYKVNRDNIPFIVKSHIESVYPHLSNA